MLIEKGFYLFEYARVVDNETEDTIYIPIEGYSLRSESIYNLQEFGKYVVTLDLNKPKECEILLEGIAKEIEANSPIAKYFNKLDNVGEGVYFTTTYQGKFLRLKAKGLLHGGKSKSAKPFTSDKSLEILAIKLTPVWRITQGIKEVKATEKRDIGSLLKWVNKDIIKEETDVQSLSKLDLKTLQICVAKEVKTYYFDNLKGY